ncbi:hypothetical protein BO71DRAFT_398170 [Aspergillus ellipticus CBS 707.79]|uniref:Uncharacterized protein n=1 Tax=Aspergillus ellipticus CBS 707.79 TaxID=1448320 RepID=A0A319DME4_9EURO|nr:hypothetical protein BO71DRAFT_398170 [Aspergillus ellipticus CBS 707.79]
MYYEYPPLLDPPTSYVFQPRQSAGSWIESNRDPIFPLPPPTINHQSHLSNILRPNDADPRPPGPTTDSLTVDEKADWAVVIGRIS